MALDGINGNPPEIIPVSHPNESQLSFEESEAERSISPKAPCVSVKRSGDENFDPDETIVIKNEANEFPYSPLEMSESEVETDTPGSIKSDLQQVNEQVAGETFLSTDFTSLMSNAEWDMLVNSGSGNHSNAPASKWERESLYQKFDPLVSESQRSQALRAATENVETRMEQSSDESIDFLGSKLICVDTPPPNKATRRCPERKMEETPKQDPDVELFVKPLPPKANGVASRTSPEVVKSDIVPSNDGSASLELQEVNKQLANETFVSSDFSTGMTIAEWELLVDRGSGAHADTKWDRESLYQRFDPLISPKERGQALRASTERLASLKGQTPPVESLHPQWLKDSKLISIDTPPPSKNRGRMTMRATETGSSEIKETASKTMEFSEPLPVQHPTETMESDTIDANSNDNGEIQKLKITLEKQAKSFHEQLQQRALQLKEIEATIVAASKKLESQQESSRVMKEYQKSVAALENEVDRVKRQITKTVQERSKIVEERDYAADDLRRAELAFSDLHSKYEKAKTIVSNFKKNEEILNNRHELMKQKLEHRDVKLKYLQDSVEDVFQRMKGDYETRLKSEDMEGNRIRAQLRKLELRMSTLEKDLGQKDKENAQLGALCDELIKSNSQRN